MSSLILNVKEIGKTIKKAVYISSMQVEAVFKGEATSPMSEMIIKPCNERLTTRRNNSIEHNRGDPLPALMSLIMMKMMLFTNRGQELHKVNPSLMMKSLIIGENVEALLAKEWELTL